MPLSGKMMVSLIFCGVLFASLANAKNESASSAFQHYKIIYINESSILVDPSLRYRTITSGQELSDLFEENFGDEVLLVNCGKDTIEIGYSRGPSEDPMYGLVVHRGKKKLSKIVPAQSLAISSSCQFYASGHTNNSFDMRRKFVVTEKGIKETEQPLYLVNKTCATSSTAILTTEKCGKGTVVATVPKGSDIHILGSEWLKSKGDFEQIGSCGEGKESYLVATPFGLVGWVENTSGDIYDHPGQPLSCIYVMGD